MNKMKDRVECIRCLMDTSDTDIIFDDDGVCNYCHNVSRELSSYPNDKVLLDKLLKSKIDKIKSKSMKRQYDCIIGLSGGVDSCYLALRAKEWGLRVLALHVDTGWNSEISASNIRAVLDYCGFDLITHVVDWSEMRDLQRAYLKSGISNQDVPQDHVIFASLYHFAVKNNIKTILSGGNLATEGVFPTSWHGSAMDAINLKDIHRKYGEQKLINYRTISFLDYYLIYPFVRRLATFRPLNYINYNKLEAEKFLQEKVGFQKYERKHGESRFTKFFQNYYLPARYEYDKRRPHLSSMIIAQQITKNEAIKLLEKPLYNELELEHDVDFICSKLKFSRAEFEELMMLPICDYRDFKNWDQLQSLAKFCQKLLAKIFKIKIKVYS